MAAWEWEEGREEEEKEKEKELTATRLSLPVMERTQNCVVDIFSEVLKLLKWIICTKSSS